MADDDQSQADDQNDDGNDDQQQQQGDQGSKLTPEEMEAELRSARQEAAKYRRSLRATEKERDDLRSATQTDSERIVAEAKAEGKREALAEANSRLLSAEIRSSAAGKLADPADAVRLLDLDSFIDADGNIDDKAIRAAIDDLVRTKPYLAAGPSSNGSFDGGARGGGGGGNDMNAIIRERMRAR